MALARAVCDGVVFELRPSPPLRVAPRGRQSEVRKTLCSKMKGPSAHRRQKTSLLVGVLSLGSTLGSNLHTCPHMPPSGHVWACVLFRGACVLGSRVLEWGICGECVLFGCLLEGMCSISVVVLHVSTGFQYRPHLCSLESETACNVLNGAAASESSLYCWADFSP